MGAKVYVFGGEDVSRRPHGDLYIMDMVCQQWTKAETTGTPPSPRSAHVAASYMERYLLIFGGGSVAHCYNDLHVLDTLTLAWSQPASVGTPPSPRAGSPPCPALASPGAFFEDAGKRVRASMMLLNQI